MSSKKAEARERIKAMREEQARSDRRRERMMRFGVAGAVVVAVAIIAVAVAVSRGGGDGPVAVPEPIGQGNGQQISSDGGGGILVGDEAAPVTIDYWMDFLCPHCKEFEEANGAAINDLVDSGQANIVYHPLTFTGGAYSTRANNAFACAADEGMGSEFLEAAFVVQEQWSTSLLVDLGEQAGIGGDYESCVRDSTYDDWSTDVGETAREFEITGTPTVFVNGELLDSTSWTPEGVQGAVETVAAGGSIATPAPEAPAETPAPAATE